MSANLENSAVATGPEKVSFPFQSQRKAMPKNVQTTTQLHSSHTSKVMLKILQARLQQYVNCELPDVQASFRKDRGTRDHIYIILRIIQEVREFQESIYFCFTDYAKAFDCGSQQTGKFLKRYQITLAASSKICMQV